MPGKILLVAALMASVALAQPFVNAPLLPLYNSVDGNNNEVVVGVVVAGGYAFTANSMGVYAMNTTAPTGIMPPFWDALPGVTQMWAHGNWSNMSSMGVIAIAGSTVALYKMNMTAVWREATLWTKNATFNLQTDSSLFGPSNQYPAMVPNPMGGWMFVLGTKNTSNLVTWVNLPSTVYAVNPVDLSIVWMTQVNSDTTNFATSFCSEYVWVLTQNTVGDTTIKVRKLHLTNGTMTWWSLDTGYWSLTYFNVQFDQFMVLNSGGYFDLYWLNGFHIGYQSIPTCGTMPYAPIVIDGTWLVICGSNIYLFNNMTFAYSVFSANSNIRCGAIHEFNHDFVLSGRDVVYVGNSSGIFTLVTLPAPATSSSYSYCTGATFDYSSPRSHAPEMVLDILHLSFIGSGFGSVGTVLIMDYRTGEVHFQAAGDVSPFGAAIVDFRDHRLFVASAQGPILQGYDFVNVHHHATSFVVDMSSTSSKYFSIAYNAANRCTYYVSSNAVYSIDWIGNSQQVGVVSLYTSNVAPVMIGQFLVVFDSYYGNAYVYDSVAKTMTTVSTCDLDEHVAPVVSNMILIMFCTSSSIAANVVDVSATTPTVKEISASNYRQASGAIVLGTTLIITTGESTVEGFDMTTAMSTATWTLLAGLTLVISPIVEYMNNGYFVAYAQTPNSFATYVYRVSSAGTLTQVGELAMNTDTSFKRLIIKSGGVFGGGVMYIIGYTNITAYTTAWTMMFNYKSTSGAVQTMHQNNPVVLDSGAVCFYTSNGWFNVVGGFEGALAWRYPSQTGLYYPVLSDNTSIFFTDGQSVIGANVYTGTIASVSTYLDGNTRGFAIAAGVNGATVIGATDDEIIFANQVNRYQSAVTNFPSSGSAPKGNNNTFGDDDEKSKAWIAGAVVGGIVVIAVVVFVLRRAYAKSLANHYPQAVHQRGQVQHGSLKTVGPGTAYGTAYGTIY